MKDKPNPLGNIIEFTGSKGWVAKTSQAMTELQGALSELDSFNECYLVFSPKNITPANRKDFEKELKANVVEKIAQCLVMLDGLCVIFGEEQITKMMANKGRELFKRYEEELANCVAVANYMQNLGKRKNDGNSESRPEEV